MRVVDAFLMGVLMSIVTHHGRTRHGPRAAAVAQRCIVDADGTICTYSPTRLDPSACPRAA